MVQLLLPSFVITGGDNQPFLSLRAWHQGAAARQSSNLLF
jgi:hypothetical protein